MEGFVVVLVHLPYHTALATQNPFQFTSGKARKLTAIAGLCEQQSRFYGGQGRIFNFVVIYGISSANSVN
jgi:hypothetical protein